MSEDTKPALCGSGPAHYGCRFAGEIKPDRRHLCAASPDVRANCPYRDILGMYHHLEGIEPYPINS